LGLGVLSSVPSQAIINADLLTLSASTAAQTTAETFTATSAVATATFFGSQNDSISVTAALVSAPSGNTALPVIRIVDTSGATVDSNVATVAPVGTGKLANSASVIYQSANTAAATVKYAVYLATTDANDAGGNGMVMAPATAGTYVVKLTPAAIGAGPLVGATAQTLTITVTEAASLDTKAAAATSKVYIQADGSNATTSVPAADSSVVAARAGGTKVGYIYISQKNAASGNASESITAAISGSGILGTGNSGASIGRSISVQINDTVTIYSDGTSGTGTITITGSTSGNLLSTKTVTFYGATTALTGTIKTAILGVGSNTAAVTVGATDASAVKVRSLASSENIYAFSSDTTIATVLSTAVSGYSVDSALVTVTGVKAGTATITFGNATTLAASTIKSTPVSVRVGSTSIASVKVAFDKTTYAPGEKAIITVTNLDSTGLPTVPGTLTGYFASAKGLKEDKVFLQNALSVDSTTVKFDGATSATAPTTAGSATYVVYMPSTAGTVTVTGTLGTGNGLAAALESTAITATATVSDSGAAALAAVTALATTVASLRTLIVTLTNLVLKIQKKVKA
jgi:hypothetical protein